MLWFELECNHKDNLVLTPPWKETCCVYVSSQLSVTKYEQAASKEELSIQMLQLLVTVNS